MAWKTVELPRRTGSKFVKYGDLTKGDVVVEGVYKERRESNFSEEDNPKYDHIFELDNGEEKTLNSCSELNYKLDLVDFGTMARIVYQGMDTVSGQKGTFAVHRFQVDIEGGSDGQPF